MTDIDSCPTCSKPTHASESDDAGRCVPCMTAAGDAPLLPEVRLGERLVTADERKRLEVLVPDPLVRTEVLNWLEATRLDQQLGELLFRGAVAASIVDGEIRWVLTETGRGDIERRLMQGGGVRVSVDGGA